MYIYIYINLFISLSIYLLIYSCIYIYTHTYLHIDGCHEKVSLATTPVQMAGLRGEAGRAYRGQFSGLRGRR